jgi:hypothetical protein
VATTSASNIRAVRAAVAALVAAVVALGAVAEAQGSSDRAFPRAANGRPDLSGIWQSLSSAAWNIEAHAASRDVPAGTGAVVGGPLPYQPWAAEQKALNARNRATADPETKCYLPGVPRLTYTPLPFQIVQSPDQVLLLHEYAHAVRTIYTNGTPHPKGPIDWWLGDSRGQWEGDTLVVDSVHFNDQTWFDRAGNFHSDALHVVERFTPQDRDHLDYHVTIDDPKVFTRPWDLRLVLYRRVEPDAQLLEYECAGFDVEGYYP